MQVEVEHLKNDLIHLPRVPRTRKPKNNFYKGDFTMKKLRKIVSLLLAVVMMMSLVVVQAGASGEGSITISNATVGESYAVYQLLDLTYATDSQSNVTYSYTIDSTNDWYDFFTKGDGAKYVTITTTSGGVNYVTWNSTTYGTTEDYAAFAQAALSYADTNGISATASDTAIATTLTFSGLDLGYYLVTSSIGSVLTLNSTAPNATVEDKNGKPTIEKEVSDAEDGTYDSVSTAGITDTVYFKTTLTGIDDATSLTLHDSLGAGFTYVGVTKVELYEDEDDTQPATLDATEYTVTTPGTESNDACTFEVNFDALLSETGASSNYVTKVTSDKAYLVVYYTATVNSNAVIGNTTGNLNTTWANTGSSYVTAEVYTTTYVYELYVYKYTTDNGNKVALEGAEFILYYEDSNGDTQYAMVSSGVLTGWTTTLSEATTLVTDSNGFIHIEGLNVGEYVLEETKAPDGYALLSDTTVDVKISADDTTYAESVTPSETVTYGINDVSAVTIENSTSSAMPSTGGIGTTIFYVVGGILVVGAIILLITKKRMKDDE